MRKTVFSHLAIFASLAIGASLVWAGGNDWKTKPYQQWDEKDVEQILGNSPWVKAATVTADWRKGGYGNSSGAAEAGPGEAGEQKANPQSAGGGGMQGGGYGQGGSMAGQRTGGGSSADAEAQGGGGPEQAPMVSFTVRWNSSRTIREALAQNAVLSKKITEADAEKYLAEASTTYDVFVTSQDMTPFAHVSESELQDRTFLEAKQSKQKITPSKVNIQWSDDKKKVTFVLFSFPRQTTGNQALVTPKDKNVEFQCKMKNLDLHTNFDLKKMVNDKSQDL